MSKGQSLPHATVIYFLLAMKLATLLTDSSKVRHWLTTSVWLKTVIEDSMLPYSIPTSISWETSGAPLNPDKEA